MGVSGSLLLGIVAARGARRLENTSRPAKRARWSRGRRKSVGQLSIAPRNLPYPRRRRLGLGAFVAGLRRVRSGPGVGAGVLAGADRRRDGNNHPWRSRLRQIQQMRRTSLHVSPGGYMPAGVRPAGSALRFGSSTPTNAHAAIKMAPGAGPGCGKTAARAPFSWGERLRATATRIHG